MSFQALYYLHDNFLRNTKNMIADESSGAHLVLSETCHSRDTVEYLETYVQEFAGLAEFGGYLFLTCQKESSICS